MVFDADLMNSDLPYPQDFSSVIQGACYLRVNVLNTKISIFYYA
jgi:hypothetical protein